LKKLIQKIVQKVTGAPAEKARPKRKAPTKARPDSKATRDPVTGQRIVRRGDRD
jgi:hypothetical protein